MLEFRKVAFTYKDQKKTVLENINFSIQPGECVLITGLSGSGKSTLIHLMNGLIPTLYEGEIAGSILLEKQPLLSKNLSELAADIGYVSQDPRGQFFTTNTTSELVFAMENFGLDKETMERNLLEITNLLAITDLLDRNIFTISSGERQKISIGCSLCLKPKLIILDEPSSNLDFASTKRLAEVLAILKEAGYTIIIAEHRLHYLQDLIDKVFLLQNQTLTVCQMNETHLRTTSQLRSFSLFTEPLQGSTPPLDSKSLIKLSNITYQNILTNINLDIKQGDVIGLIGENGAGKTTLLRLLTSIIQPTAGYLENFSRKQAFLVMQDMDYQFFTESVMSELHLGNEHTTEEERLALLNHLGLRALKDQLPFKLSGGQKQRLLIGIASLARAQILLFDEPTSGLDYTSMLQINNVLNALTDHAGLVIATHDIEFIYQMCNRIVYLNRGKIQADFPLTAETKTHIKKLFLAMNE